MERNCLSIKLRDKVKNVDIRKKTKVCDALTFAMKAKWRWAGHVARYKVDRWTLRSIKWSGPKSTRSKGRPRARWADEILACAGRSWLDRAKDREGWHSLGRLLPERGPYIVITMHGIK